jgi:hypothetical protein
MRRAAPLAAALALLLAAGPARAGDVTFNATTTSIVEYHWDNEDGSETNDDFVDVINKLNFSLRTPILQTDMRIDTFTLLPAPWDAYPKEAPAGKKYRDDYRLERITGVLRPTKGLKLTFGDFFAQFGNGIVLALRKVDELGLETVLRGGRIDVTAGLFSMTLLGGVTNVNNVDVQDYYYAEDPMDRLAGLRLDLRTPDARLKLGVHTVYMQPADRDIAGDGTYLVGGSMDTAIVPGKLMMGFEGDWGWFDGEHHEAVPPPDPWMDDAGKTGYALYLNLKAKMGPVSLLVEGKLYDAFALEGSKRYETDSTGISYTQPPTAERIDQEVDNTHTVMGGRLKIDWRVIPTLTIFGNIGGGEYVSLAELVGSRTEADTLGQYLHGYGGVDWRFMDNRSTLVVSGGYRAERKPKPVDELDWTYSKYIGHAEAKLNLFLHRDWTLHATALHEQRMKKLIGIKDRYMWGTYILGVSWAGTLDVSGGFEYDTPVKGKTTDVHQGYFGFGVVKWYIRSNLIWSVFAGTQRGGLKCVGGVCKMVPAFAGVKTELVFRY